MSSVTRSLIISATDESKTSLTICGWKVSFVAPAARMSATLIEIRIPLNRAWPSPKRSSSRIGSSSSVRTSRSGRIAAGPSLRIASRLAFGSFASRLAWSATDSSCRMEHSRSKNVMSHQTVI